MNLPANISDARLPQTYEDARHALAECQRIDECQSWADKAEALASYAKQADDDSLRKMADRIQARAIRRAGELLKQIEPAKNQHDASAREGDHPSRKQAATDAGMSDHQRKQALRVASVPDEDFEQQVESDSPPTVTKLAEQGKKRQAVDLGGRTKDQYNKAMHFEAMFIRYAKEVGKWNVSEVIEYLTPDERAKVRQCIESIDAIHDQVITRI